MSKLILASASPRRLALLRQLGYDPQVQVADVDETAQAGERPEHLAQRLARSKATVLAGSHPEHP
ncbi:Maf family protein, partial [Acidithiobacillus sp.]|uniref:Maf family protein n=1 Tax=Acidithiobacillus sp. TaxID=1872118 RepID=UPI0025C159D4